MALMDSRHRRVGVGAIVLIACLLLVAFIVTLNRVPRGMPIPSQPQPRTFLKPTGNPLKMHWGVWGRMHLADAFGEAVGISGRFVVVGAPGEDTGARDAGSAYLLDAASGDLLNVFNNPTPAAGENYGSAVAISGNKVVVGSRYDSGAYLFDAVSGAFLHTFQGGSAVAISGDKVLVGAEMDGTAGPDAGSAYLFEAATGKLLRAFNNPNPTPREINHFGGAVAVSENFVVVGAPRDDTGAHDAGSVYLYDAGTGALLRILLKPRPAEDDAFGHSVGISGNLIVVGAHTDDSGARDSGSVFLYDAATGNLLRTIKDTPPCEFGWFGFSVAISGSNLLVGAHRNAQGRTAYVFDASTGALVRSFSNPTPARDDAFGHSVAISGNFVVVGDPQDDAANVNEGSAYFFPIR